MSNASLVDRMKQDIAAFRREEKTSRQLAESLSSACRALEGMPYELIKLLDDLAMDLQWAGQDDLDGFVSTASETIDKFEAMLSEIPTSPE